MDDFWGDSYERDPRPEGPADVAVKVRYAMTAEIERQALAARWHRLRLVLPRGTPPEGV
jgi:hypothetical protein